MGEMIASKASQADIEGSVTIGALGCKASAKGAVVMGRRVMNDQPLSLALGDGVGTDASPHNRAFHLFRDGTMMIQGPIRTGIGAEGIGVYFPNASGVEVEPGNLMRVNLDGSVSLAPNATEIFGVSAKVCMLAFNGDPLCWGKRYMTDDFGQIIMESYFDTDAQNQQRRPKQNPAYDHKKPYVPRSERPLEWTLVIMTGLVYVRVDSTVRNGDRIWSSTAPGIGKKTTNASVLHCLTVTKAFDAAKGYGVAQCYMGASV